MDTNLVTELIRSMSAQKPPMTVDANLFLFAVGVLASAIGSVAGAIISYFANKNAAAARLSAEASAVSNAETEKASKAAAVSAKVTEGEVQKIHISVNSERTAMADEIRGLKEIVLKLSQELAVGKERQRSQDLKDAAIAPVVVHEATVTSPTLTKADVLEMLKEWGGAMKTQRKSSAK